MMLDTQQRLVQAARDRARRDDAERTARITALVRQVRGEIAAERRPLARA